MPLLPSLQKLKSSVADYQNHSDRERAGALFAATFLRAFVPPEVKGWAHLDLASMLFDHQENISKPYGVKLLLFFLMEFLPS
jgi:leucyl aminopeptidase